MNLTGSREAELLQTIDMLLDARRTVQPMQDLPIALQPTSVDEVYFVQDRLGEAFGTIGGWKIGAPSPDADPLFAPMPAAWMAPSASVLSGAHYRFRGLEAEVAFLLGKDLPPRQTAYTRNEVVDAIRSCHPAIEVLESGLLDPNVAARMSMLADLQMHGGFLYGPAYEGWQHIDFAQEHVSLAVDGILRVERTGSNTAGDLLRLLPYLANEGAARTGGLHAGQWVTTGSWTGNTPARTGSSADVQFSTLGRVTLRFA